MLRFPKVPLTHCPCEERELHREGVVFLPLATVSNFWRGVYSISKCSLGPLDGCRQMRSPLLAISYWDNWPISSLINQWRRDEPSRDSIEKKENEPTNGDRDTLAVIKLVLGKGVYSALKKSFSEKAQRTQRERPLNWRLIFVKVSNSEGGIYAFFSFIRTTIYRQSLVRHVFSVSPPPHPLMEL